MHLFFKVNAKGKLQTLEFHRFYSASIRSILEYGAPVCNYGITVQQCNDIETSKKESRSLYKKSHTTNMIMITMCYWRRYNLTTLKQHGKTLCQNLLSKIIEENHHLHSLLRQNNSIHPIRLRIRKERVSQRCYSNRHKHSFIPSAADHCWSFRVPNCLVLFFRP